MTTSLENRRHAWRLGAVSYLNAKPLIAGLDTGGQIELVCDVPSRLPGLLDQGRVDAALVPVIDLVQENRAWRVVSDAALGCDGETMTVRVFSRVRPKSIREMHVDGDSHTSVVLARILWHELYDSLIELVPFHGPGAPHDCDAILLIGDKVVNSRPVGYELEIDLGAAWKSLTGLPFVFAVWAAPRGQDVEALARRLSHARDIGVESVGQIAAEFGPGLGWPVSLAQHYLKDCLRFTLGPRQLAGMARFLNLAKANRIVEPTQELVFA